MGGISLALGRLIAFRKFVFFYMTGEDFFFFKTVDGQKYDDLDVVIEKGLMGRTLG